MINDCRLQVIRAAGRSYIESYKPPIARSSLQFFSSNPHARFCLQFFPSNPHTRFCLHFFSININQHTPKDERLCHYCDDVAPRRLWLGEDKVRGQKTRFCCNGGEPREERAHGAQNTRQPE